ncbi:unnamed protein product, partial [Symbiodinium natans]
EFLSAEKEGRLDEAVARALRRKAGIKAATSFETAAWLREFRQTGRWDLALAVLAALRRSGGACGRFQYAAVLSVCSQAAAWAPALHLLEELREANVETEVSEFTAVVLACERSSQWIVGLEKFLEMESQLRPDLRAHTAALQCARSWPRALAALGELAGRQMEPDSHCHVLLLSSLAPNDWELGFSALETMPSVDSRQLASLARAGSAVWTRSLELMRNRRDACNIYVYNALAASVAPWPCAVALLSVAAAGPFEGGV